MDDWETFQQFKSKKFSDVLFRHLYANRDENFSQTVKKILKDLKKEPFIQEDGVSRPYGNMELLANFY